MRIATLVLIAAWLACPSGFAAELEGVEMPDTVTVEGTELRLNGLGIRKKLWFEVYVAGLYLERTSSDPNEILDSDQIKRLRMHFLYKKVAANKLTDAWTEGLEANVGDRIESLRPGLDKLNGWMEDVVKGDEMTFTSIPGKGLRVQIKGREIGVIEDEAFSEAFWSIFLGEKPPTGKLKSGLLGS
jgi:hypothetical protein